MRACWLLGVLALSLTGCSAMDNAIRDRVSAGLQGQLENLRLHAREQIAQELDSRSGVLLDRVEARVRSRVGDVLQEKGVDPVALESKLAAIAAANNIDVAQVKQELRSEAKQGAADALGGVLDRVFGEKSSDEWTATVVQQAAAQAEEKGRASALEAVASAIGPKVASAGGGALATALGFSGPVGAAVAGGAWWIGRALRRRRKEEVAGALGPKGTGATAPPDPNA